MKIEKILGLGEYAPKEKYVCFLPFRGEFGWYLMTFVKRVQGYNAESKIVCIKPGHECLFPSSKHFFYEWQDVADERKAGINDELQDHQLLMQKIRAEFGEDIFFVHPTEASWEEKNSLANYTFVPENKLHHNLQVDVVLTPRHRKIDAHRNWTRENWQRVVDGLTRAGVTVGVCGSAETSFELSGVSYKAYDYVDVDSDVELMLNSKLVVSQESGLAYLSYLCKRPTLIIDHYHRDFGADLQRDPTVFFKEVKYVWSDPDQLVAEILSYLKVK
jgi:hypothetical protein